MMMTFNAIDFILGIDPAGPRYKNTYSFLRLDETDAQSVVGIHTNGGKYYLFQFGILAPVGHVDFYPNGGKIQPGCEGYFTNWLSM